MNFAFMPAPGNKYFNTKAVGGYSTCILGNSKYRDKNLNVLPNCVGFAWGWLHWQLNDPSFSYRDFGDACKMLEIAQRKGLKTGRLPKVGGIMVWSGGSGDGHCAVVKDILSGSSVRVIQSGYSSKKSYWEAIHNYGSDGSWTAGGDASWMQGRYKYLGCIYFPEETKEEDEVIKSVKVNYNGTPVELQAINKDGTNYIRLRDLDEVLGLAKVGYDAKTKTPTITT